MRREKRVLIFITLTSLWYNSFMTDIKNIEKNILDELKKQKLEFVWKEIETPIISIIEEINKNGWKINIKKLKELSENFNQKIQKLEKEIYELAGEDNFNIKSTQQLSKILFEKMELPTKGLKKTPKGVISTKESELLKLQGEHIIIDKILEFRELAKMTSTYIDNLIPEIEKDKDSRLHYQILQMGTSTGRMSSKSPNIQNIPTSGDYGKEIRKVFIAEKGFKLVGFDYSQIELRIAAILSQDKKLLKTFENNEDIHSAVSQEIFGDVSLESRRKAKVINFGILYGMGVNSLSKSLETDRKTAQEYLNNYFEKFSGLTEYINNVKEKTKEDGFTRTLYGRKRFFPEINSKLGFIKAMAERMAVNAPIQGSSADIIKLAMGEIWELLKSENILNEVKPIAQIHDELIFEIKENKMNEIIPKIKEIMEKVLDKNPIDKNLKKVPLIVEPKIGDNWSELK